MRNNVHPTFCANPLNSENERSIANHTMGQEQSYTHAGVTQVRRYKERYDEPLQYRSSPVGYRANDYEEKNYKRRARRSADSFKSDNSSTESSGYRSGSSAYEYRSDRSSTCDYYCTSLYKNEHYREVNKELYKPVKLHKEKRYNTLQQFDNDKEELKSARLKSYLSETEKSLATPTKKPGIRNYTPKILSAEDQRKRQSCI
ncbi:unnamed protein product [Arctia plantaginis]|uniref:Uncharacterized protein n=1 Tax=Arctia plantaginis TaxID=874455 RepID=A0A8S1AI18_ARCPL|nr:unnamed protein product [Arctia plantaginis]